MASIFEFQHLPAAYNYLAPDTSEIRLLPTIKSGGLCHCTLPAGKVSIAVKHKTVDEIWYCISGIGEIWQRENNEFKMDLEPFTTGNAFTIPVGNSFQFRNIGKEPLTILIITMPQWPGPEEAEEVEGLWK